MVEEIWIWPFSLNSKLTGTMMKWELFRVCSVDKDWWRVLCASSSLFVLTWLLLLSLIYPSSGVCEVFWPLWFIWEDTSKQAECLKNVQTASNYRNAPVSDIVTDVSLWTCVLARVIQTRPDSDVGSVIGPDCFRFGSHVYHSISWTPPPSTRLPLFPLISFRPHEKKNTDRYLLIICWSYFKCSNIF